MRKIRSQHAVSALRGICELPLREGHDYRALRHETPNPRLAFASSPKWSSAQRLKPM
jgi:hypothetical protein